MIGDGITNANTLVLTGAAAANSSVKIYDGATLLGLSMFALDLGAAVWLWHYVQQYSLAPPDFDALLRELPSYPHIKS